METLVYVFYIMTLPAMFYNPTVVIFFVFRVVFQEIYFKRLKWCSSLVQIKTGRLLLLFTIVLVLCSGRMSPLSELIVII